jgi:hypothetical protein
LIDGWLYFYDYFDARQSTQKIDSLPDPVTCPVCGLTYCSDLERERASHRTFHHKHLHVHHPQPEPRLAGFGEGDIRVDASSRYLLNQLVYERALRRSNGKRATIPLNGPCRKVTFSPAQQA